MYADFKHTINKLPNEDAGLLFKHILSYVNGEDPKTDNILVEVAFEPIKQQLKRDLDKWDEIKQKRSDAGKASAESKRKAKQQSSTKSTSVESVQQDSTNPTVSVNDNVTVNVTDNVNVINNRKEEFKNSLFPFKDKYSSDLLNEFFTYWTEKSPKGKKMRFEMSKSQPFDPERRLVNWKKNQDKGWGGDGKPQSNAERLLEIGNSIQQKIIGNGQ